MQVEAPSLKESKRVSLCVQMKTALWVALASPHCWGTHSFIIYCYALFIMMLTHEPQSLTGILSFPSLVIAPMARSFPPPPRFVLKTC